MDRRRLAYSLAVFFLALLSVIGGLSTGARALTTEEEKILGRTILAEIEKSGDLLYDLRLQGYLDRIGQTLVAGAGVTPFEFRFYLFKAQEPNAFAIPGGYVFVTTGLLVLAESEDEVAGVLAHEIAHVMMRHISQIIDRSKRINIASMAAMIAAMIVGGGGKGSEAIAATAMAASQAFMLKYTRENETDADRNSLHYLVRAGYDPEGLLSFMKKVSKYSLAMAPKMPAYLSTHPAAEDRISLMENLIKVEPVKPGSPRPGENYKWVQARAFVDEREPYVAVNYFESRVKTEPQDVVGMFGLGFANQKAGRLDRSIEILEKASALAPKERDLLSELGVSYFLSGKIDQAILTLESVRSLPSGGEKSDLATFYYLGRAYQEKGDFPRALDLFLRVQKDAPGFLEVCHSLGSVYGRMGHKGQSHLYFGKYFKLKGDRTSALLHFRTAQEALDRTTPERAEADREIRELRP